jgi:hypothetical protein
MCASSACFCQHKYARHTANAYTMLVLVCNIFGDNQQLSCTAADTCKLGSLSSERIMCGACPSQSNPSIQEYACDYITSICTCAVPQLRESSCLVNDDCMQLDDETSCMIINDDLQISRSSILCSKCQFQSMCFHSALGDSGVCACGTR